jgi:glucokinase
MGKRGVIGIDIGGTKTLCALFDERLKLLDKITFKTAPPKGRRNFSSQLTLATQKLVRAAKGPRLEVTGVGVACAGRIDSEEGVIIESPNIPYLEGCALRKILKTAVSLPSVIGNDVQLALYGEHRLGVAAGCANVLGVFFGTGVGGAAIINNEIFTGSGGHGGNIGSTLAHPIGGAENLQSHGILDQIASKASIAGAALGMASKQWTPNLYKEVGTDMSKVTWGALERARKKGDKHIDELLTSRLRIVGISLSSIINFLNPDMLVLGGGLTEQMPRLVVAAVESGLREYLLTEISKDLKVKAAKLGNKAGAIGAARLALKKLEKAEK